MKIQDIVLSGLGLDRTAITDAGIATLRDLSFLQYIECEDTAITPQGLQSVLNQSPPADNKAE